MSHNEQLPLPPQIPDIEAIEHLSAYAPLGREAILAAENAVMAEAMTNAHLKSAAFAERMNYRSVSDYEAGIEEPTPVADQQKNQAHQWDEIYRDHDVSLQQQLRRNMAYFRGLDEALSSDDQHMYKRQKLNDYIAEAPGELDEAYREWSMANATHPPTDVIESDRLAWLAAAPKSHVQKFLSWHHDRIEALNREPEITTRIENDKAAYKDKLEAAVAAGLPKEFLAGAAKIDTVPVSVGDIFHTVLQSSHGYTEDGKIVLEERYETAIFDHEMSHALFQGLEQRIDNEAFAEHVKLVLNNGNPLEMNPDNRSDYGLYSSERSEMALELTSGIRSDLMQLGLKAFAEEDLHGPAHRLFDQARNESYGGIDTRKFRKQEMARARERVENFGSKLAEDVKGDYILRYAGSGFKILGAMQRGESVDEIIDDELTPIRRRYQENPDGEGILEHLIPAKQEEITSHIAEIQAFLANLKEEEL